LPMIAHIADVHLGAAQYGLEERFNDVFESFGYVVESVVRERPDALVIAGDLFDKPRPGRNAVLRRALRLLRVLDEKGIPVIVAHGEHDTPPHRDETVLMLFSEVLDRFYAPHVLGAGSLSELADRMTVKLGGLTVYVTPFIKGSPDKRRSLTLSLFKAFRGGRRSVLLGHFSLEHEFPLDTFTVSLAELPRVSYAALGHIHRHILNLDADPVYAYPGILDPLKIDEAMLEQSRLLYVDLSGDAPSVEAVKVPVRPQRVVTVEVKSGLEVSSLHSKLESLIRAELDKASDAPKPPLIHVIVRVSGSVPKSVVALARVRLEERFKRKGVLLRFKVEDAPGVAGGRGAAGSAREDGRLDLVELAFNMFSKHGLTREEVDAIVRRLVEALTVEEDYEKAEAIIAELASRRSPRVWERILEGV